MSRYTNDIDNVQTALEQSLIQLISSALSFAGAVVMMIILSPPLFLVTALVLALMFFITGKIASQSSKYSQAQQKNLGHLNGYIEEMVDGLKVVKVFNYENIAIDEFKQRNEAYRRQSPTPTSTPGGVTGSRQPQQRIVRPDRPVRRDAGGVGPLRHWLAGRFPPVLAADGLPVQQISNQLNIVLAALAGAERVFEVMDQEPEVDGGRLPWSA